MRKFAFTFFALFLTCALYAAVELTGPGVIENIAGVAGKRGFSGDSNDALAARLASPLGMVVDRWNNIYIADTLNHRIRFVNARTGRIYTVAGTGKAGFFNDGGNADLAGLRGPTGLAMDRYGNLIIADTGNHRIRMLTPKGYLHTIAGNGSRGYEGEGSRAKNTALNAPTGVAVNSKGEIFIADTGNHRIRKIDRTTGILTTVVGKGYAGDDGDFGLAGNALLNKPSAILFDKYDNLYIADTKNHKIRFVDHVKNLIFTFAGRGSSGYCGDNNYGRTGDICFNDPTGLALDRLGRLYVADTDNQRIRRININLKERRGEAETVVGSGERGYNGANMDGWDASLAYPGAMVISPLDMLYFLDTGNNLVRRVQAISRVRPPTGYSSFGQVVHNIDSRSFVEVLFAPQKERLQSGK